MTNKIYNGFKLIIGGSFTLLGGLTYFLTGSLLNKLIPMMKNPNNPKEYQNTMTYISNFKQANIYSIILTIIGAIISMHAIIRLFQAKFEEAAENTRLR